MSNSAPVGEDVSVAELVKQLSEQTSRLERQEVELAKAELAVKGKRAGLGAGMFGGAAAPSADRRRRGAGWRRTARQPLDRAAARRSRTVADRCAVPGAARDRHRACIRLRARPARGRLRAGGL